MLAPVQPMMGRSRIDQTDFDALINQRGGRWYQACLRLAGDPALAEDAVQDALLKAWHRRDQFRGSAELDTWVHRIAINATLDLLRRERRRSADAEAPAPAQASDPAADQQAVQMARDLDSALGQLTEIERNCFVLKHLQQWKLDEIADALDNSLGSVKQALFRALRKLRSSMQTWRSEP